MRRSLLRALSIAASLLRQRSAELAAGLERRIVGRVAAGDALAHKVQSRDLNAYDAIAFGCPAMGSEVLEEMEFQPMFDACKRSLGGKRAALFGSYGWGDGEWMRSWEKDCGDAGLNLVCESVTCCDAPDDAALEACRALGKALVE